MPKKPKPQSDSLKAETADPIELCRQAFARDDAASLRKLL